MDIKGIPIFKKLSPEEAEHYRKWARDNYEAGNDINILWHPVVREECERINERNKKTSNFTNPFGSRWSGSDADD